MFNSRRARTDPDIDPRLIESSIIKEMIPLYDSYICSRGDDELHFFDGYQRYYFTMLDTGAEYKVDISDYWKDDPEINEDWFSSDDYKRYSQFSGYKVRLPTLRMIYIVPHHRRKGLQRRLLEEVKEAADRTGESIAIFADPMKLSGYGRETNAVECLQKLEANGYEPADDYAFALHKQRMSFLKAGFRNIRYTDARVTQPYQSFVYVNKQATEKERALFDELEVFYESTKWDNTY